MSRRFNKYASMGVSYRDGQDDGPKKPRKNNYRRQMNSGNYIGARQEGGAGSDDLRPQLAQQKLHDAREAELGWPLFTEGEPRLGWLLNFTTTCYEDLDSGYIRSAVDCYFMCQDGSMFKARVPHFPYFYLQIKDGMEREVEAWMRRKFEGRLQEVEVVHKEDLDLKNHLSGLQRKLLKITFWNVQALMEVRKELFPIISRNKGRSAVNDALTALQQQQHMQQQMGAGGGTAAAGIHTASRDVTDHIVDMREYDVPYHVRFVIDTDVRAGHWFTVTATDGINSLSRRADLLTRAEPVICAWDIETTKLPLQFPNAEYDQVFMISYMVDRKGFLLVNREVVGGDVDDFEFSPKPEFEGPFTVVNLENEEKLLLHWFDHMRQVKPAIHVTYNGDFFDFPFVCTRAAKYNMDLEEQIGFSLKGTEWISRAAVHMDCLHWVNRDSYLPQGSRGLKAVCKTKLGYDPVEVAPEDMVRLAQDKPQVMASYSVSDAVATYYLYMTYIHPFIFSLATIIPMPPDEVLRKGSGTLCEQLLMVEAYRANIICPNKHTSEGDTYYKGHLLDSETYIGGKVEALESGVFRSDLPTRFKCKPSAYQQLIDNLDRDLGYAIEHDGGWQVSDVANYEEVKAAIKEQLEALRDTPNREEVPLIYHLDVAAMYPNIILTNRLQPPAIVTDEDCAACDFNRPGKTCLRQMEWVWRGEHFACSRNEVSHIKKQLASEVVPPGPGNEEPRRWDELAPVDQAKMVKDRLKKYCQKVYKRVLDKPVQEKRIAGVCQRENSFYVDTVRAFRDRRYEYKGLNKKWKGKLEAARSSGNALATAEATDMVVLYDSLQLAHKCILNSFYGYVMRKGARWYSMEMAGVVTNTGAKIIQNACRLVEQLGKPLELDTDGIWCALPGSFPENFKLKHAATGKDLRISYPCVMLNVMVAETNTNDQYQDLVDPVKKTYKTSSQMSIEFEVDGPYKAMILPASKEEGKLIKKRYAVFNFDGSLAELKGFEIKRRGELKLIKVFQAEVFEQFLAGNSLEECYGAVAAVANRWLDILDTQGCDLTDDELLDYISESTTMSKGMDEYEGRKSCAITTAKRLAQFLGDERIKDKGLSCQYIIARKPEAQPTSERAIPVSIFRSEPALARSWLRAWCGDVGAAGAGEVPDVRDILDWAYYRERLGSAIMKIITIPAAMQHVANPVPRIRHPEWLYKKVRERDDRCQQLRLDTMFAALNGAKAQQVNAAAAAAGDDVGEAGGHTDGGCGSPLSASEEGGALVTDLEDMGQGGAGAAAAARSRKRLVGRSKVIAEEDGEAAAAGGDGDGADEAGPAAAQAEQQPMPDWQEDYPGWLEAQKVKWRAARQENKRRKVLASKRQASRARDQGGDDAEGDEEGVGAGGAAGPGAAAGNLGAYLRQQQAVAARSHWQILQLAPTATPGVYKMWVLVDASLYAVPLRVPRQVVINSTLAPGQEGAEVLGQPTKALLPMTDTPYNLYQLTLPEADWQANINQLSLQLLAAGARGVYEGQLPLAAAAALSLGCVVTVAPAARKRPLGEGFDLHELQMRTTTQYSYLEGAGPDGLGLLRYATLYHSTDSLGQRSTFCLLLPAAGKVLVQVVARHALGAKEVTPLVVERAWRDIMGQLQPGNNTQEQVSILSNVECSVEYWRDALEAARHLQRALAAFREVHRGPLVLLVQSPGGWRKLVGDVPLLGEFPCIDVPLNPEDARYPALQWQVRAARRALQAVAVSGGWVREQAALTRYAHVPLGGLGPDPWLSIADVLYARNLRQTNHVLWCKDPSLPELGIDPVRQEDYFLIEELPGGCLNCPGAYRTICVELRLHHLAVAALDQATAMADMEGASGLEALGAGAPAFKVLRQLVQAWIVDATQNNNVIADTLLQQVYRWVSNPDGQLHDPGIHRALAGLMQRLFLGLVVEMKRLGAELVAAEFGTILINTKKRNLGAAVSYTHFLLETLGRRELFQWIQLTPQRWWHVLHYMDKFNYGGVEACLPAGMWEAGRQKPEQQQQQDQDGVEQHSLDAVDLTEIGTPGGPKLSHHWNLVEFLPPALQEHAIVALAEFMYRPWAAAAAKAREGATQGGSQAAIDAQDSKAVQLEYLRKELSGHWGEKLLNKVQQIAARAPTGSSHPDCQFPQLAGSHLTAEELGSPALAFVKTLCYLMGLDQELAAEVRLLRRRLLRLLGVGEFTAEAGFKDPCISFKLEDVICSHCHDCRELDLCRDPSLSSGAWLCSTCQHPYDKAAVEARLVSLLQARLKEFALQDVVCGRCKTVASSHLQGQCTECGGPLLSSITPDLTQKRLVVFRQLGSYHGLQLLQELAEAALCHGQSA